LLRGSVRRFIYNAFFFYFFPPLTKQFMCSCTAVPLVFHVVLSTLEACKAEPPYLSPVYISPSPVPSAIVTNDSTSPSFLWLFATILPQRWKQLIIARRLIVAIFGTFQGFFSYGIIRRVNLFSDQSACITSLWSFAFLFVWDSLKLQRLIVTSDAVCGHVCCHVGYSSVLIQHVWLFFTTRRYLILSDLKRHPSLMPTTLIPSVLQGILLF
jgi:hypothetical protein